MAGLAGHQRAVLDAGEVLAVREYKRYVKTAGKWAPASVNQALAAIDNFYRSRNAGLPDVAREDLPQLAPRQLLDLIERHALHLKETDQ